MFCGTRERALMINTIYGLAKTSPLLAPIYFHAVWMMDMTMNKIPSAKGGILALTCFVLASKYEEESHIVKAQVEELLELAKLWKAEKRIWRTLDYNLTCPNLMFILRYISWEADDGDRLTRSLAKVLLCCAVFHKEYVMFTPLQLVTASLYLAKSMRKMDPRCIFNVAETSLESILPAVHLIKHTVIGVEPMNICGPLCGDDIICDGINVVSFIKIHLAEVSDVIDSV